MAFNDWTDVLKVAIPALGAYGAAWLTNRKERKQWEATQRADQLAVMSQQGDRLAAGWSEMTAQAREIMARLQVETIDAKTRAAVAESKASLAQERALALERDLAETRKKYEDALAELERLRPAARRRPKT